MPAMRGCPTAVASGAARRRACWQRAALPLPPPATVFPQLRFFAGRPNFEGFPFGGGFPGGAAPPRGDAEKFYRLLDVPRDADESKIKSAYKKQAMKHHPDRGGDEATFKEISKAYEVLSDPEKRQIYDAYGEEGLEGMGQGGPGGPQPGTDPFDLFSQIFGFNAGGRRTQRGKPVTPDSMYELQVSLEDLYRGTRRDIVFNRDALCQTCNGQGGRDVRKCSRCNGTGVQVTMQQLGIMVQQIQSPCSACGGRGTVVPKESVCTGCRGKCTVKEKKTFSIDVEPGSQDGSQFRFRGQADEQPGHDTGDVVIVVREKAHKTFKRVKESLVMSKTVSLSEALCGFEFSTTFLDGNELVIRSAPGQVVKPGDFMVVEGKGMPRPHGQKPGDLLLLLDVEFPTSLPRETRHHLLDALGGAQLSEEIPPDAAEAKRPSARRAQEFRRSLAEGEASRRGGGEAQCAQQ